MIRDFRRGVTILRFGLLLGTIEMRLNLTASAVLTLGIDNPSASLFKVKLLVGRVSSFDRTLSVLLLMDPLRLCRWRMCSGDDCGLLSIFGRSGRGPVINELA
jgi:hypothetical protein